MNASLSLAMINQVRLGKMAGLALLMALTTGATAQDGGPYQQRANGFSSPTLPQAYQQFQPSGQARSQTQVQYYTPPEYLPTPGNKPPQGAPTSAPASNPTPPVPAVPQPPYAYPPAPGAAPAPASPKPQEAAPAPKSPTAATPAEVEALRRENYLLNQRLAAAQSQGYVPPVSRVPYIDHTVKRGDSLWGLAIRYKTRSSSIRAFNHLPKDKLVEGQVIRIPVSDPQASGRGQPVYTPPQPMPTYTEAPKKEAAPAKPAAAWGKHIVHPGETLSLIAQHYNVSTRSMQSANGLRSANKIYVGQELLIPGRTQSEIAELAKKPVPTAPTPATTYPPAAKSTAPTAAGPRFVTAPKPKSSSPAPTTSYAPSAPAATGNRGITSYRVQKSDTLESVAKAYNLSPAELRTFNRLPENKLPPTGDVILVPTPAIVSL